VLEREGLQITDEGRAAQDDEEDPSGRHRDDALAKPLAKGCSRAGAEDGCAQREGNKDRSLERRPPDHHALTDEIPVIPGFIPRAEKGKRPSI
jgi:hypothetical protein